MGEGELKTIEINENGQRNEEIQKLLDLAEAGRIVYKANYELDNSTLRSIANTVDIARAQIAIGDIDGAKETLGKTPIKNVDRFHQKEATEAFDNLVDLQLSLGNHEAVKGFLDNEELDKWNRSEIISKLSKWYGRNGREQDARELTYDLDEDEAYHAKVLSIVQTAQGQFEAGDYKSAMRTIDCITPYREGVDQRYSTVGSGCEIINIYLQVMDEKLKEGDTEGAKGCFSHAKNTQGRMYRNASYAQASLDIAGARAKLGEIDRAKEDLISSDIKYANSPGYIEIAKVQIEKEDIEGAKKTLIEARESVKDYPNSNHSENKGLLLLHIAELQKSIGDTEGLKLTLHEAELAVTGVWSEVRSDVYTRLIEEWRELGEKEKSEEIYEKALISIKESCSLYKEQFSKENDKEHASNRYVRDAIRTIQPFYTLLIKDGKKGDANELVGLIDSLRYKEKESWYSSDVLKNITQMLQKCGDMDKMDEILQQDQSTLKKAYNELAIELVKEGKIEEADRVIAKLSDDRLIYRSFYYKKAKFIAEKGKIDEAIQLLTDTGHVDDYEMSGLKIALVKHVPQMMENYPDKSIDLKTINDIFNDKDAKGWREIAEAMGIVGSVEQIEQVLASLPDERREIIQGIINTQALKYKSEYGRQKQAEIYSNTREKLLNCLENKDAGERELVKYLTQAMYYLDNKDAKSTMLNLARDSVDEVHMENIMESQPHLMRVLKALGEMNTFRGNDLALQTAADFRLNSHLSAYLFGKLIENGYLDKSLGTWYNERAQKRNEASLEERAAEGHREIEAVKMIILKANVMPSQEIMEYLVDSEWKDKDGKSLDSIEERIEQIKSFQAEFEEVSDANGLVKLLAKDSQKAMVYYVLNNGKTRFDLINNYSFDKFKEVLGIIDELEVIEGPMDELKAALSNAGMQKENVDSLVANLAKGKHPFYSEEMPSLEREVRLDVSDNMKLENANFEVANVLGRSQLGACLKAPLYRKYLQEIGDEEALRRLQKCDTLTELESVEWEIEEKYYDFINKVNSELSPAWRILGEKMAFNTTLENILIDESNHINTEEMIANIEDRRISLKTAKRELILALKQENPTVKKLNEEIRKKKKAVEGLEAGLANNPDLQSKIDAIRVEMKELQTKISEAGLNMVSERFSEMPENERRQLIDEESQKYMALSEKDPAAIFVYLIMETLGEEQLTENDANLIKEVASHLEGPFQMVADLAKLDESGKKTKQEKKVKVRWLDKKDDLMTTVRFADSKICCFSSNNYEMQVAHDTPNKQWVASINKDPCSFVFEIEEVEESEEGADSPKSNLGFVFGMFGVSANGKPEVMLNGVYLSTGNDKESAQNILGAIESMLSVPINAEHQFVAMQYGGEISGGLDGYNNDTIEAKRLRALDSGYGEPETQIYDDLGTEINEMVEYSGSAWHKGLE